MWTLLGVVVALVLILLGVCAVLPGAYRDREQGGSDDEQQGPDEQQQGGSDAQQ